MNQFDSLRLAMVSGKGGVGKTTLSCGFARRWAQKFPDEQILLISTDPAHSLGDVLHLTVTDTPVSVPDLSNLRVRALDAEALLQIFKARYGKVLELLVERGSFVEGADLTPVWDLSWPGLDELMGILEIQRLLREQDADRVVVDMAPSGHTLNLFGLMDFLDRLLEALDLFQQKHRELSQRLTGRYVEDDADTFLSDMNAELAAGRALLQDQLRTACLVVAIAEPMSWHETRRLLDALDSLQIPVGGLFVNHLLKEVSEGSASIDQQGRLQEQQDLLPQFLTLRDRLPVWVMPKQEQEPVGAIALDCLMTQVLPAEIWSPVVPSPTHAPAYLPQKVPPGFNNFIADGRNLIIVGGKGGVGKTTIAAAIAWGMAARHPDQNVRVISIDPAHSLGDALGIALGHDPQSICNNLSAQEVDADRVLDQFRDEYLWELADMMSGENGEDDAIQLAYGPDAWRKIVAQSLPGIDEMLSLMTVMDTLEQGEQDLIVLDTAPTGHLLRFLAMPTALSDWLSWIFKLWLRYQDVVGRTELMGRLRTLRKRVMRTKTLLTDPAYTEFIGVIQAQSAIVAEAARLSQSLQDLSLAQRYVVHNRYDAHQTLPSNAFAAQTLVRLPELPRAIAPLDQIQIAADLVFDV